MALLEESYRKFDPEGVVNKAYISSETKTTSNVRNVNSVKTGKNPLEA